MAKEEVWGSFPHFLINTGRRKKRDEKIEKETNEKMKEKKKWKTKRKRG